jgi:hypothetical protein
MIILDENINEFQKQILKKGKYHFKQIGNEIGKKGMEDENIIPLLLRVKNCTFFTSDRGFYDHSLCHKNYCIVFLSVSQFETSTFIKRFLQHVEFNNQAKRKGKVFWIDHKVVKYFDLSILKERKISWN